MHVWRSSARRRCHDRATGAGMHVHVERLALSECAYTERLALACMCMKSDWRWTLIYACAEQSAWRWHACAYRAPGAEHFCACGLQTLEMERRCGLDLCIITASSSYLESLARVAFVLKIHACHQVRYHNMSYDSKSLLSILLAPEHDNHQVHDELVVTTHRAVLLS